MLGISFLPPDFAVAAWPRRSWAKRCGEGAATASGNFYDSVQFIWDVEGLAQKAWLCYSAAHEQGSP
jgi:hypothetical protein